MGYSEALFSRHRGLRIWDLCEIGDLNEVYLLTAMR